MKHTISVELEREEIGALLAALNFTYARTYDSSWLPVDDQVKAKLLAAQASDWENYGQHPWLSWKASEDRM